MASTSPPPRRDADTVESEARVRIAAAARDLFAAQGYEQTTVEAIAERAGVARRTFFRHFRSKDDAIFPDHARIAQQVEQHLTALGDVPPLTALAGGVRMVFRSYVDDPVVSVERYRLTRSSPALRDREIASVSRYTRLFARYLRRRFADTPDAALRAEVTAAAFVATHNFVLRGWLRAAGEGDPLPALDAAFDGVASRLRGDRPFSEPAFSRPGQPGTAEAGPSGTPTASLPGEGGEDVVVAVFRSGESIDDVVERISRSL
jgi:AcrR family transcriptional regulator